MVRRHPRLLVPCRLLVVLVVLASASQALAAPLVERTPIDASGKVLRRLTVANLVLQAGLDTRLGFADDTLRVDVLQHLRSRGYPAVGADDLVFGRDKSAQAELALGGVITAVECYPKGRTADRCSIKLTWSLLDLGSDKVVLRMQASYGEGEIRRMQGLEVARRLLLGATDSLLARPEFVQALEQPAAEPAAAALQFAALGGCSRPVGAMPAEVQQALAATVLIQVGQSSGSGFFVTDDGYLLTAAHVVEDGPVQIVTKDGQRATAELVRVDRRADVALLRTTLHPSVCFELGQTMPAPGASLFALGAPLGDALSFSLTRGVVSGARRLGGVSVVQTDASVSPGNSGGPLVDEQGRAVAVVSAKLVGEAVEGIAFGVLASSALDVLALQRGAATDALLRTSLVKVSAQPAATVELAPDAALDLGAVDTAQRLREKPVRRNARILLFSGLGLMGVSVPMILVADPETASDGYVASALGLLVVGGGLAISAPIYRAVGLRRVRAAHVAFGVTPRSAQLSVRF